MIIIRWIIFRISIISLFPWIIHPSFIHNLDVMKERIFKNSPESYFGYSLSVYRSTESTAQWLVGSPGENLFQGAVYKCNNASDLETGFVCRKVEINSFTRTPLELARNGWFGATVVSSREFSLFCSPRTGSQAEGECFTSENRLRSFTKVKLPLPRRVCLSGFSATYMPTAKGSLKPFLGGPTCLRDDKPNDPSSLVYPALYPNLDKWYLGYAMTSGMYGMRNFEQGEFLLTSVAFHINSSFAGKVYLLNPDTKKEMESLVGYQPGEHFGASLAVSDFTGDGRDDIVVGAPHHTDYNSTDLKVEIGAVYIYYQTPKNTFNQISPHELRGQTSGSRFGYTVAAIGDTDADGFNDLAIGAPYENEGIGTVYIYRGSESGLRDNPQIIFGSMFSPPLRTFGFAITGGDFDGNKYSDVAIGAYESAAVVYIPARPIANIESKLLFVSNSINLEKTEKCSITNFTDGVTKVPVACEDISFCITYSGLSVEEETELRISISLDFNAEKGKSRILFYENNSDRLSREMRFTAGSNKCLSNTIYVKPGVQDLTSIAQAKMTIELTEQSKTPNRLLPIFPKEYSNIISNNSLSFTTSVKVNTFVDATPWWVYVASGLGALLILAIITGVLYKLGFFKRKLPPNEETDGEKLTEANNLQQQAE